MKVPFGVKSIKLVDNESRVLLKGVIMFGLNSIIEIAVIAVLLKFPEETKDYNQNKFKIFDLSNMISEELQIKHRKLFFDDYVKNFVEVKDLDCEDFVQIKK